MEESCALRMWASTRAGPSSDSGSRQDWDSGSGFLLAFGVLFWLLFDQEHKETSVCPILKPG